MELLYQTISYCCARNLGRHQATEISRFLDLHDSTASASTRLLASARGHAAGGS